MTVDSSNHGMSTGCICNWIASQNRQEFSSAMACLLPIPPLWCLLLADRSSVDASATHARSDLLEVAIRRKIHAVYAHEVP